MKSLLRPFIAFSILLLLISASVIIPQAQSRESLKEAQYYRKLEKKIVQCQLCPRFCVILPGKRGFCGVRENRDGVLYTMVYAKPVAIHLDPIEKKPLFHFLPSTTAFSIATAGCNLRCKFCQNWEISQVRPEEIAYSYLEPEGVIRQLKDSGAPTIAYTYSEPTIFYEYMLETAKLAKERGFKNIMHSCGYINEEPLRKLAKYLDAANIDLKGFSDAYYAKLTDATLEPVLRTLKILKEERVHLEITNLILTGYNDDPDTITKMCLWIRENLGADTPVHFSRFFPMYKMVSLNPTPPEALERARQIALDCGLNYVYIGNLPGHSAENTYCPRCKKLLVERRGYFISSNNILKGKCKFCGLKIAGVWD